VQKQLLTRLLLCLIVLEGARMTVRAQNSNQEFVPSKGRPVTIARPHEFATSAYENQPKLIPIAGDLSTFKKARYFGFSGLPVLGSNKGGPLWRAVAFTPSTDGEVRRVEVAVQFLVKPTKVAVLSLNNDANGLPGTAIQSWHIKVPQILEVCCILDIARDQAGIPVKAGKQYWVVVSTDTSDPDFLGTWSFSTTDMRLYTIAFYNGIWNTQQNLLPAFAVLGTK
jgi:hypothetical protein